MRALAFDPGGTTGWAIVERIQSGNNSPELNLIEFGQEPITGILGFLQGKVLPYKWLDVIVFEGFIARPDLTDGRFTRMDVNEIIGAIRLTAHLMNLPCVEQQAADKPVGYGRAGMTYVKHNRKHWQDAVAHAAFYLLGKGLQGPPQSTPWPPETVKHTIKVVKKKSNGIRRSRF